MDHWFYKVVKLHYLLLQAKVSTAPIDINKDRWCISISSHYTKCNQNILESSLEILVLETSSGARVCVVMVGQQNSGIYFLLMYPPAKSETGLSCHSWLCTPFNSIQKVAESRKEKWTVEHTSPWWEFAYTYFNWFGLCCNRHNWRGGVYGQHSKSTPERQKSFHVLASLLGSKSHDVYFYIRLLVTLVLFSKWNCNLQEENLKLRPKIH